VARVEEVVDGENKGKRLLGKAGHIWENDVIKKRRGIKWIFLKWLQLFQNSDNWWSVVNRV
jgi:hypothetical protein